MNPRPSSRKREMEMNTVPILAAPRAPQAQGGVLDLQTLNPGDPAVIRVLANDAVDGDSVVLDFGGVRCTFTIQNAARRIHDIALTAEQLALGNSTVNVTWSWRTFRSRSLELQLIDFDVSGASNEVHAGSASGLYEPGLLDAWIIPAPYRLEPDAPVIRALDGPAPAHDLSLPIEHSQGSGSPLAIGAVHYDATAKTWSVRLDQPVDLFRADLLSIRVPPGSTPPCNFVFAF